jgi:2-succinyl-6-hydroxy-2,4-cyclohexadiene-1-carboxylate synthase
VAVDLPGHGDSGSVLADLPTTAELVAEAVRNQVGPTPCALLGYSLGARVALHVALADDLPLRQIVTIGVTAGIEDPAERERRRQTDQSLADGL